MIPKVSVLMSVYNGEKYLVEAVQSILSQTYSNFELIIVNDGSTDNTAGILASRNDSRVKVIHNSRNIGLAASLNKGIAWAQGEYLARMDVDDISLVDRFEKQVAYLENHSDIGVLGCAFTLINAQGQVIGKVSKPTRSELLEWSLLFGPPLAHPAVMMRTDIVKKIGGYSTKYRFAQDYDLWGRLSKLTKLANLPDHLLQRRDHADSVSIKNKADQEYHARQIQMKLLAEYMGVENAEFFTSVLHGGVNTASQAIRTAELYNALFTEFHQKHPLTKPVVWHLQDIVGRKIFNTVRPFRKIPAAFIWYLRSLVLAPSILTLYLHAPIQQDPE